ncbi:MAG: HNH endonuclease [Planctomycetes bacterium]|nr:HNH endonuclease [Planctomycetota bacterium]
MPSRLPTDRSLARSKLPGAEAHRPSAAMRGYGRRWRRARFAYLAEHPLCRRCKAKDRLIAAECVDHIVPHRGDQALFWDTANWQALCLACHSKKTATEAAVLGRGRPRDRYNASAGDRVPSHAFLGHTNG